MVTYDSTARFHRDFDQLSADAKARFKRAIVTFVDDLKAGTGFRPGLRVKRVQGTSDIWEMTWAPDGRATFEYGPPIDDEPHVIWRRVGTHAIFTRP